MDATCELQVTPAPFPIRSKHTEGDINGIRTDVTAMYFADKIVITLAQDGKLAHWVHVPLESTDPNLADRRLMADEDDSQLLPMPHLSATTVLGTSGSERDTLGQLFATQVASAIAVQRPEEKRLLVVGMGFAKADLDSESFLAALDLALQLV